LAQTDNISIAFRAIPSVNLPYYGIKIDQILEPQRRYHFPVSIWGNSLNVNLWKDLGLTIPLEKNSNDFFHSSAIYRKFTPSNGSYYLGIVDIVLGDDLKKMLVTATNTGEYIDALEINVAGGYWVDGLQSFPWLHVKQFTIDADMKVTVYRLIPTSSTPIMFGANTEILTTINAQRIDEIYQIDSTGQFIKTGEIKYQPKDYPVSTFSDVSINFWEGDEITVCGLSITSGFKTLELDFGFKVTVGEDNNDIGTQQPKQISVIPPFLYTFAGINRTS